MPAPCSASTSGHGIGELATVTGHLDRARTHHVTALDLATQVGFPSEQARAHNGLAHASQATGHPTQARHHWQRALSLYSKLNAPEANEIRAKLSGTLSDTPVRAGRD